MPLSEKCPCAADIKEKTLVKAVEESDVESAAEVLASGCSADIMSESGFPLTVTAAKNNSPEMTELLLKHNPNISITDRYGRCALVWGIMNKNPKIYVPLLERHPDLNVPGNILVFAIAYGEYKLAEYILPYIHNVDSGWISFKNPIMWAASLNNESLVSKILMKGPNITDISITDNENLGDAKTERFMADLVRGDDPETKKAKETRYTRKINIYNACSENRMVRAYKTLFDILAERSYRYDDIKECVKDLIESGLKTEVKNSLGRTPLAVLAFNERGESLNDDTMTAELFLKAGADINTQDNDGNTPLHHAVSEQYMNMVNILMKKGADPLIRNRYGYSARELAALIYPANPGIMKEIERPGQKVL